MPGNDEPAGDTRGRNTATEVWYLQAELEREVTIIKNDTPLPGEKSYSSPATAHTGALVASGSPDEIGRPHFAILGAGRLGISLGLALTAAGATVCGHTGRSAEGRARAVKLLGAPSLATVGDLAAAAFKRREPGAMLPVFLITVPDAELEAAARVLAEAVGDHFGSAGGRDAAASARPAWAALHTSGATPVSVLDPCAARGALTLSLHPLQTFSDPVRGAELLRGAAVAVTPGPDETRREEARELGERVAQMVGGRPFLLEERDRTLYHAAAVMASNYLVTVEHAAEHLFLRAGLPATDVLTAFLPLARGALDNIEAQGTLHALTGPLSRGDGETVAAHLRVLDPIDPDLADLYRTLGHATLDLVRKRGELPADAIDALENIMTATAERAPDTATGAFTVMTRYVTFSTRGEGDVIDLTDQISHLLRESGLTSGTVTVFAPGATGAVTTLEFEPGVVHDFQQLFARIIPADDPYRHNLLLQDGNGHSHVRAGLLGPSLVIPFVSGRLTLGTWQEAVFVCFDHIPRDRKVIVQFMGVSEE